MVSYTPNTSYHRRYRDHPNIGVTNRRAWGYLRIGEWDNCHKRKPKEQLLSQYKRNSRIKSQEYSKFLQDKKSLWTILYGQCDEATQTEIALWDNYTEDRNEGRLLAFFEQVRAICFSGDDGGLSYPSYKQIVTVKSLNTCINNEVHDPNSFKEQVKIKYKATKAIVRRSPNGITTLMHILSSTKPDALD